MRSRLVFPSRDIECFICCRLSGVAEIGLDRLMDKTVVARKSAMVLLGITPTEYCAVNVYYITVFYFPPRCFVGP